MAPQIQRQGPSFGDVIRAQVSPHSAYLSCTPPEAYPAPFSEQFSDPESRTANVQVLQGLGLFVGAIVFITQLGDFLVPAF